MRGLSRKNEITVPNRINRSKELSNDQQRQLRHFENKTAAQKRALLEDAGALQIRYPASKSSLALDWTNASRQREPGAMLPHVAIYALLRRSQHSVFRSFDDAQRSLAAKPYYTPKQHAFRRRVTKMTDAELRALHSGVLTTWAERELGEKSAQALWDDFLSSRTNYYSMAQNHAAKVNLQFAALSLALEGGKAFSNPQELDDILHRRAAQNFVPKQREAVKQAKSKDVNEFEALCSIAAQRLEFPMTAASVSDAHKELLREQERKVNAGGVVSPAGKVLSKAYGAAWLVVRRKGANDPQDLQVATSAYIARKKRSTIDSAIRAAATLDDAAARTIERNVASIASRLPFPLTAERAEELLETQPFSNPKSAPLLEAYVACAIRFCGDAVDEASLITHLETYRNGESK